MLDHRPLHRMLAAQTLHRAQRLAVQHGQEQDAGIDRAPNQLSLLGTADQHRAGAAIPFGTALLAAGPPLGLAQPVKHGRRRIDPADRFPLPIQEKADLIAHSAPPVGGVSVRRQQQGHMIMRSGLADTEIDRDHVEKGWIGQLGAALAEIVGHPEFQAIAPDRQAQRAKFDAAPVLIGGAGEQLVALAQQTEENPRRRASLAGVEHMGRESHDVTASFSRSQTILPTSSSAVSISVSALFFPRASIAARMPALSVRRTQMMNGKPNRRS